MKKNDGNPDGARMVKLLNDMLDSVERAHGPLPTENGDLSRLLLQRYKEVLPASIGNSDSRWVVPPPRMPVTTRIITFLVGDPYKPSFATVTGRGDNPR